MKDPKHTFIDKKTNEKVNVYATYTPNFSVVQRGNIYQLWFNKEMIAVYKPNLLKKAIYLLDKMGEEEVANEIKQLIK